MLTLINVNLTSNPQVAVATFLYLRKKYVQPRFFGLCTRLEILFKQNS